MPSAAPIRPRHLVSTQQGVETEVPNDLTPFRKACIFTTLRFVKTHALRLSRTKNLHFAIAPFPRFPATENPRVENQLLRRSSCILKAPI